MEINSLQALLNAKKILYVEAKRSVLRIKGPDARSFIQRMSTNDMNLLTKEKPLITCFLNNKGKLVDAALVFLEHDEALLLISSFAQHEKLELWLENFHFVEDFILEEAQGLSTYYSLSLNDSSDLNSLKLGTMPASGELRASLFFHLSEQPLETSLSAEEGQLLLLSAQVAQPPGEINEAFMPQNVGLLNAVSLSKGCYIGQEVIAKALNYQKNTKRMAAFLLKREDFARAKPGMKLHDAAERSGIITTLASIYREGLVQGLAVVEDKIAAHPDQGDRMLAQFIF